MTIFDKLRIGIRSESPACTEAIGEELGHALADGSLIAISGDLGAGKTTLVRGVARSCGVAATVTSPTFNLYAIYQGSRRQLLHLDAWRLNSAREAEDLMLDEFLRAPFLVAVEWPGKIGQYLDDFPVFEVRMALAADGAHQIWGCTRGTRIADTCPPS